jgi:signal peptidase II
MGAGAAMAALVLAADQGSKAWILHGLDLPDRGQVTVIPGLLDLVMVWNHGVTFGLFQAGEGRGQILLAGIALAVVAGLLAWLRRAETLFIALSLGAIAGGALGNVTDRFRYGMVVDFLHAHWYGHDPFPFVFNGGDSAIVLGVAALLLDGLLPAGWRPVLRKGGGGKAGRLQAPPPNA